MDDHAYLVRYGLTRHVGLFAAGSDAYLRGQPVILRTHRGTELGEILLPRTTAPPPPPARILRPADPADLERARRLDEGRPRLLDACERIFRDGVWPLDLIDVEPLLDDRRAVLHYLGPHRLDVAGLLPIVRDACGLDVSFEPAGIDPDDEPDLPEPDQDSGGCGGGCSAGKDDPANTGSGSKAASSCGNCSGCSAKALSTRRSPGPPPPA